MLSTDATPAMELPMRLKSKSAVGATVQGAKRHRYHTSLPGDVAVLTIRSRIHVDTIRTICECAGRKTSAATADLPA